MPTLNLIKNDPWLSPYELPINERVELFHQRKREITNNFSTSLEKFATGYNYFGLHNKKDKWIFREWAPNAENVYLVGEFSDWKPQKKYQLHSTRNGIWEISLPISALKHKDLYKLLIIWPGGQGERIPAWANRVVQDEKSLIFNAQVWSPKHAFKWTDQDFSISKNQALIYEAHAGMAGESNAVSTYRDFTTQILPRIIEAGYNTIQLMAVQEHPYYGSFGYHVSNFFAPSSRFGTPEELKELINEAHKNGIAVIMDIVHSHAVKNELEGLSKQDGTYYQYFHDGPRGDHPAWDSRCFNYSKKEVLHFLLSNCAYWIKEFHFDGYRFDGVTSMLYLNHGLEQDFTSYDDYFTGNEDQDAIIYLTLANKLIHTIKPDAITIAEEMSAMPGIAANIEDGGIGFNYRLSMGIPDFWIKTIKEKEDHQWNVSQIFHELSQHRAEEKTISYAESHDQALVGDKTIIFRLIDKDMYYSMAKNNENLIVDRGLALHKMIRLITLATNAGGYLNFMGNEFGHPEWIDFPREGNNWSYHYARRQWSLMDNHELKYHWLSDFDKAMINVVGNEIPSEYIYPYQLLAKEDDQILAFQRGEFIYVFNFNPTTSFTNYGIPVGEGKYRVALNTDNKAFGGFGNIDEHHVYYAEDVPYQEYFQIKLYLPSRTAFVLKKQEIKRIY